MKLITKGSAEKVIARYASVQNVSESSLVLCQEEVNHPNKVRIIPFFKKNSVSKSLNTQTQWRKNEVIVQCFVKKKKEIIAEYPDFP